MTSLEALPPSAPDPTGPSRILVVDDEESVLTSLSEILRSQGHDVDTARSGYAAIEKIESAGRTIDLVITDLSMAGKSGLDVLDAVRARRPETVVIMITGYASLESAIESLRRGAFDYLIKPVEIEQLLRVVAFALDKRKMILEVGRLSRLMNVGVDAVLRSTQDLGRALERIAEIVVGLLVPLGGVIFHANGGLQITVRHSRSDAASRLLEDPATLALGTQASNAHAPQSISSPGRSILAVPVNWHGRHHGSIIVCDPAQRTWTDEQVDTAVTIAGRAAVAIENAGLYRDVSEEKERFRVLLNAAGDGIVGLDADGRIMFFSRAAERLTGHGETQVLARPLDDFLIAQPSADTLPGLRSRAVAAAGGLETGALVIRGASGPPIFCDVVCCDVRSSGASVIRPIRWVVALRDARERRRQEEQKTEALAQIAHELKSPLASLSAHIEVMLARAAGPCDSRTGGGSSTQADSSLRVMRRNARHLGTLIESLLANARIAQGPVELCFEPLRIAGMLEEAHESFDPVAAERGIRFTIDCLGDLEASVDRAMLVMAVNNLILNAFKFTAKGGQVSLVARDGGDAVVIEVRDTGIGIPAELQEHIFQPYYQVDRSRGGTGLGLSVVRSVVEGHGGRVGVESRPGEGSRFRLTIPKGPSGVERSKVPAGAALGDAA